MVPSYKKPMLSQKQAFIPDSQALKIWNSCVAVAILFFAIEVPLQLAFQMGRPTWLIGINLFLLMFLAVDMWVQSRTGYYQNGRLIRDLKKSKERFFKGSFAFQLIITLPLESILLCFGVSSQGWVRLLHLLRTPRLFQLFPLKSDLLEPSIHVRIFQYIVSCVLASHWIACGWLGVDGYDIAQGVGTCYNLALYWTITTLTTVGYGDISPTTNIGRLYTIVIQILGVGMYGFIIGNISSLVVKVDAHREHQRQKMASLASFMTQCEVPDHLQTEVYAFYSNFLMVSSSGEDDSILEELPGPLKAEMEMYSNMRLIKTVPMFKQQARACQEDLARSLTQVVRGPKEDIISFGETGNEMYFLGHGMVEVLTKDGDLLATLEGGSFFGETALLREVTRTAAIRSVAYCHLYKLEKEPFIDILNRHNGLAKTIREINEARS
jgi:voltage-gated potassium channel